MPASQPMRACDLMTTHVYCCAPGDTAQMAARIMQLHNLGFLPVVNSQKRLMGVITERDLCNRLTAEGCDPRTTHVADCMTAQAVSCSPGETIGAVVDLLERTRVRRVVVIETDGTLAGIISVMDLVRRDLVSPQTAVNVLERVGNPYLEGVELSELC